MANPIGYSDLKNVIRLPQDWDAGYLMQWKLKDGKSFDQLVQELGAALVMFNASLKADYWSNYWRSTPEPSVSYMVGQASAKLPRVSEYGKPDPIRSDATGHMLPLIDYGGALGWTYLALRRAITGRLENDIKALIQHGRDTFQIDLLARLFKSTYDNVGNTGKSVPWADAGVADSDYIPPTWEGKSFDTTHTHLLRYTADSTGRSNFIKNGVNHLAEHGHKSPYEIIIPEADVSSWTAQTEFKKPERNILLTYAVETRAAVNEDNYIGVIETDRGVGLVKFTPRLATGYAGMFKIYGNEDARAPLAVRYEEGYPLGLALVSQSVNFPLQDADSYLTFGVGVNDRVAGVVCTFAASGNYVDPTIS